MPLLDQNAGMVDALGQTELVHASLQSTLQEVFDLERQDVIEFHAGLVKHTDTNQAADEGIAFEETPRVFFVEGQKFTVLGSATAIRMISVEQRKAYRAARRILERVSWTRHTSRLFLKPYSPTVFNSESLQSISIAFAQQLGCSEGGRANIQTCRLEGPTRDLVGLAVRPRSHDCWLLIAWR